MTIKMEGFQKKKERNEAWYNDPVYSHFEGHKMCLNVDANGYGEGEDTHMSVYVYLMQGNKHINLKWPFKGTIKVSLLNQLKDGQHLTEQVWSPNAIIPESVYERITEREREREHRLASEYQDTPFTKISIAKVLRTSNS